MKILSTTEYENLLEQVRVFQDYYNDIRNSINRAKQGTVIMGGGFVICQAEIFTDICKKAKAIQIKCDSCIHNTMCALPKFNKYESEDCEFYYYNNTPINNIIHNIWESKETADD